MKPRRHEGTKAESFRPGFVRSHLSVILLAAVCSASCGVPLMKLPLVSGTPSSDAADILSQATLVCSGVRTLTAEVAVSGTAGGHRLSGRLLVGVASPALARLEAVAPFGPPLFIFAADQDEATLLLPRDDRVLEHGRPEAVLEAVTGAPLGAADLRALLTGCAGGGRGDRGAADRRRLARRGARLGRRALPAPRRWRVAAGGRHPPEGRARVARGVSRSSERPAACDPPDQPRRGSQGGRRHSICGLRCHRWRST